MRLLSFVAACTLAGTGGAYAQSQANVDFTGVVNVACSITAAVNGALAINTTGDVLASTNPGGSPGSVTVLSIGSNRLGVSAPTMFAAPAGYVTTGQILEVSYQGQGGLSGVSQAYTPNATIVTIGTIAASQLTLNNRVTNPNGFPPGSYTTRTVVSCLPPA